MWTVNMEPGIKDTENKPRLELLPTQALEQIAKAIQHGNGTKYPVGNWQKGIDWLLLLGSVLRHTYAFIKGEDKDKESGISHLAHAGANILFLLWYQQHRKEFDNRIKDPVKNDDKFMTLWEDESEEHYPEETTVVWSFMPDTQTFKEIDMKAAKSKKVVKETSKPTAKPVVKGSKGQKPEAVVAKAPKKKVVKKKG
jgi:hypothetical protein